MTKKIVSRFLACILAASTLAVPTAKANLPGADPAVYADQSARVLLELSFVGVNRKNIRAYLAKHRPETIQGLFCQAWMLGEHEKWEESVALYTKVIGDPRAKGATLAVAAGNRAYCSGQGKLPNNRELGIEAIKIAYEAKYLNALSAANHSEWTREIRDRMIKKHPDLIKENRAAHLLGEARYWNAQKEFGKVRDLISELWAMDLKEWKGDFDFPQLMRLRLSEKVFGNIKMEARLIEGDLHTRLLHYQLEVLREVQDPVRRAVVAGWCTEFSARLFDFDTRHRRLSLVAFQFLHVQGGSGALGIFPTGSTIRMISRLWNEQRDGVQLSDAREQKQMHTLEDLVELTDRRPAIPDAEWYEMRASLLAQMGRFEEAKAAIMQAGRSSFHPDQRTEIAYYWGRNILGPMTHDLNAARTELRTNLPNNTPRGRRTTAMQLARMAFAEGDITAARKWIEQAADSKDASEAYYGDRLETIANVEDLLKRKERYAKSNPLETRWQAEHGSRGISAQLNFATASDKLPANTGSALAPILKVLRDPAYQNLMFRIEGHTDITGSDAINEPLSLRRAQSVANYLGKTHGIPPSRMEIDGFGARRPIASNLSENGRTLNRRAELNLMGDASRPQLVATRTMSSGISAVSPDGRRLLSYNDDVWDTKRWVRLYSVGVPRGSKSAAFSPDGRYLFVSVRDSGFLTVGLLIDARTGTLIQFIPNPRPGFSLFYPTWSPDSQRIAFMTGTYCHVYDVANRRFEGSASIPASSYGGIHLAWIKGGQALAMTAGAGANWLYVVDTRTYKSETLPVPKLGWSHGMASSHDARYLYISDDSGYVLDWDTIEDDDPSLQPFWRQAVAQNIRLNSKNISVHPGNPRLVALDGFHTNQWGLVNFETGDIQHQNVDKKYSIPYVFWGPDGHELLASGGWVANATAASNGAGKETGIYRLDLRDSQRISNDRMEFIKGASAKIIALYADEKRNLVIAFTTREVSVWDVKSGRQMHSWSNSLNSYAIGREAETGVFYGIEEDPAAKKSVAYRFDLNDFRRSVVAELGDFDVSAVATGNGTLVIGGHQFFPKNKGSDEIEIKVVDSKSGRILKEHSAPAATERLYYGSVTASGVRSLDVSPDGETVAFVSYWADGYGHGTKRSKVARQWNWKSDTKLKAIETTYSEGIESVHFESDRHLRVSGKVTWNDRAYDNRSGESLDDTLPRKTRPLRNWTALLEDAFQDLNLKVETSQSEIRFIRRDRDEVVVTVLKKKGEWIAYNRDGYFVASPDGTDSVFWRVGSRLLPLSTLRDKFENPALLADSMKSIFEKRVVNKPPSVKPAIDPNLFSIPYEVKILSPNNIQTKAGTYKMKVQVKALTADAPEPVFAWTVNGHSARGFKVVPARVEPRVYTGEHEFDLTEGTNVLSVALRYKSAVVMPQTVSVRRVVPKSNPGTISSQTHLWFFGVGVKDYEQPDQNLDYPDRDALELEKMFKNQEGKLFKEVHTKVLTNADATVRDIKIEMNRFLKKASSQDLIVVFLAGHGVVDTDQELYFIAHDSEMDEPYTGLELRDFADFLERRPPNQKALFLMDICHAGSFGQASKRRGSGLTSEDAVKLVEQGTGTVVLASSTGRESSLEDAKWRGGHGAFTAALLDGLEGKADTDAGNGDGYIFLTELTSFVSREVPRLTNGGQHPTTPKMENLRDFPIGKRR